MGRGGARPGSGPKKGTKYRKRFRLTAPEAGDDKRPTAAERMRALRRQVVLLVADSMSPETIAALLGIDIEKLYKVFAHELKFGRQMVRREELLRLDAASGEGKVAATKAMLANAGADRAAASTPDESQNRNAQITERALRVFAGGKTT